MQYVLPLMLVIMSSVFVGKMFTPGLYDLYIRNRQLHFLEEEESLSKDLLMYDSFVEKIMVKDPFSISVSIRIVDLVELLNTCSANCFPVVENFSSKKLVGSISRNTLCIILSKQKDIEWIDLHTALPKMPNIQNTCFSPEMESVVINLMPYIDEAPLTINVKASIQVNSISVFIISL